MQNEHIEHFKRWQETYLMWAYSNFDRIVSETVNKHEKEAIKDETFTGHYIVTTAGTGLITAALANSLVVLYR